MRLRCSGGGALSEINFEMITVRKFGRFTSSTPLNRTERDLLRCLTAYYTPDVIRSVLVPITGSESKRKQVSLRALDWLVTNYCKKTPVVYTVRVPGGDRVFNMHQDYKTWLWKYRRCLFDPFRRRARVTFELDGDEYTTTLAQLNFMRWASLYGVIEYARANIEKIEEDHARASRKRAHEKCETDPHVKKRRQLSHAPTQEVIMLLTPVRVGFTPGVGI